MRVLTDGEHAKMVAAMKSARDLLIELEREITAYQIAKDNLELRLVMSEWDYDQASVMAAEHFSPVQVY